ncbi:NADH-ubiquinone oxidoreductase-F iron-sulfur binding region domain-containing protein [Piscinibacter koreensis]|uniref:NAD(P)H-dependent oxidoreductase subunit E n=1 Tax=Piscinibacter koreensis TaxID=2742824 RepID=A0A7Y6TX77_9BURK|nr:NADH-ubiquinone oxidoreductase-F iron-sulfur binding region domain-containing protein [Schlegelella koreensis]NUZ06859.1 NAD(P)H-dependent oxidoreductase subunit E [Schlegelella koreensis]
MTTVASVGADDLRRQLRSRSRLKGRQPDERSLVDVRQLLGERPPEGWPRDRLIEHLHLLNDCYGALRERHLVALAAEMNLPMAAVYEVATFYHHFEVLPDGESAAAITVRICSGLSCQLAGAAALAEQAAAAFDGVMIRVVEAPCVGRCEQAPVAVAHQYPVAHATLDAVLEAVQTDPNQHPRPPSGADFDPARLAGQPIPTRGGDVLTPFVDYATYCEHGGYTLAREVMAGTRDREAVLAALESAGLRGLGGAGFPAGRKWRIVAAQPAPRYLAVNIDEGEPGTFKDRTFLERDPHRFLEGVLVAAAVVGIERVVIYLRDEYHGCRALLGAELGKLQRYAGFALPAIELRRGAGAYICGEESAMLESIEGKRGEPRLRPPYIAEVGLFGRPTLEHNFETLYWVRDIVERGPDWFAGFGRHGRKGLRSFSVSGRVAEPGVKLAPAGITLNELIDEYCGGMADGGTLYAFLPGGASGGILPASLADVPLDFDTLQPYGAFIGSAAIVVLDEGDRARDAALNAMRFFAAESCGQCTPCRVGTQKAAWLMEDEVWDRATLDDLADVMVDASICGLGQAAPNPLRHVLRYFPHEVGAAQEGAS